MKNNESSRPDARFLALLLVLGTLAIYLPASHYGFSLYDDPDYVSENSIVLSGLTWPGIKWAFTTWHASNWHPLTWLSHMLDCQFFGLNAGAHHVVNILLHTANAVLLLVLLRRWTNAFWASAFVAALFAWHPLHVESVAWIAERKDVLSTFFALLTLLAYGRYVRESAERRAGAKVFYGLTLLTFALALMSKPMVVTLPCVMLLLDYWPLRRFGFLRPSRLLVEKIPLFLMVAGSCVLTFLAQQHGGSVIPIKYVPVSFRLENAVVAASRYLLKLFWPENLAVFYPLRPIPAWEVVGAVIGLSVISAAAWIFRNRCRYFAVGWLWFLGTLVPVIGLVQVGTAALADRYTYFPSIGIFLIIAFGARDLMERFRVPQAATGAAAGAVLLLCLLFTHRQLNFWRNDVALFSHAVAVTQNNTTAHLNLGYALEKRGQNKEAMEQFREVLQIDPDDAEAHNNLANLLDDSGHPGEALKEFQTALRINPDFFAAHCNLGTLYVELGRYDDAMKQYAEAAKLEPSDWHPPYLEGKALLKQGRDTAAIPHFQRALQNASNNSHLLTFVAQVLASDENPAVRNGDLAVRLAQRANDLTDGIQPAVLDALGMAEAETGRFDQAQKTAERAIEIARDVGVTNDVPQIQQRLDLYRKNQPFRQTFTNAPVKELPER